MAGVCHATHVARVPLEHAAGADCGVLSTCVGAYRLEGLGAQLFARVEGDYFMVLGLNLLALLGFSRAHGGLPAWRHPAPG